MILIRVLRHAARVMKQRASMRRARCLIWRSAGAVLIEQRDMLFVFRRPTPLRQSRRSGEMPPPYGHAMILRRYFTLTMPYDFRRSPSRFIADSSHGLFATCCQRRYAIAAALRDTYVAFDMMPDSAITLLRQRLSLPPAECGRGGGSSARRRAGFCAHVYTVPLCQCCCARYHMP